MRAVLCKQYGPPESLVVEDVAPPPVGRGEVRVAVRAAGVNFPDVLLIRGEYQFKPPFPFSPGGEVSGVVAEVGPGVDQLAVGDRVIAMTLWGGFAEELVAPADRCLKIPDAMDFVTAGGFPITYGTGYHALVQRGRLQPGETLLVHGGTGGVGTAAIEIGELLGARVIATGGSDEKLAAVQDLYGVDHVINYRTTPDWKERVKALTGGEGADVIFDPIGGDVFEQSLRCIRWDGRLLVVGFAGGTIPAARANLILLKGCSVVGVFWGAFIARQPAVSAENFQRLFAWYEEGKLRPHVSRVLPLERAADALHALIRREVIGKAVLAADRGALPG